MARRTEKTSKTVFEDTTHTLGNLFYQSGVFTQHFGLDLHRAMRQLWNIHIQLGKAIGKIIMEHAALLVDSGMQRSQWINLGEEIHLPIEDVLEALDLREIATVNTEEEFLVHPILIQKAIAPEDIENLIERGMINYVS